LKFRAELAPELWRQRSRSRYEMSDTKKTPPRPKQEISDPHEFYRQGLGPGYPEEEFGPGEKARQKPDEPVPLRNFRGDRYTRFDRPGRKNPGLTRKS
jgi:hypothetical protein